MSKKIILGWFVGAWIIFFAQEIYAQKSEWIGADQMRAQLLSSVEVTGSEKTLDAALDVVLSEGWHTYWKMSGDAGLPPRFDWSASENIEMVDILWPAPVRKEEMGLQVFGYTDGVTFPLRIHKKDVAKSADLNLKFKAMVCHEICIPQEISLHLSVPVGTGSAAVFSAHKKMIDFAVRKIPETGEKAALKVETAVMGPEALVLNVYSKTGFKNTDAVAYTDEIFFTAPPEISIDQKDPHRALITLKKPLGLEKADQVLLGKKLQIYITDGRNSYEKEIIF